MNGRTNTTKAQLSGSPIPLEPISDLLISRRDKSALLTWTDPVDKVTSPGGELAVEWDRTIIIRKEGSAPSSYTDGTIVLESYVRDQYKYDGYTDSGLVNETEYFYGIYTITTVGVISELTVDSVIPRVGFIYLGDTADGTIDSPGSTDRLGYTGRMRESFNNNFYIRWLTYMANYDSDLVYSRRNVNDRRFSEEGTSVSDENYMLYASDLNVVECWDTDLISQTLTCEDVRDGTSEKTSSNFIIGCEDVLWSYDRSDLTASNISFPRNQYITNHADMAKAGNYIITFGSNSKTGDDFWLVLDDDLVSSTIDQQFSYIRNDRIGASISNMAIFFGESQTNVGVDSDLIPTYDIGTHLPHVVYNHDVLNVNGFAVICGGSEFSSSQEQIAYYDFSAMDNDFLILNRGVEKLKYRRYKVLMGTTGNKLIVTSRRSDQLAESENMTISNDPVTAEVYTF